MTKQAILNLLAAIDDAKHDLHLKEAATEATENQVVCRVFRRELAKIDQGECRDVCRKLAAWWEQGGTRTDLAVICELARAAIKSK